MVANQSHAKGNARFRRVSDRSRHTRIRHRRHEIGYRWMLLSQQSAQAFAAFVHRTPENHAVGTGEVNVLEDAILMRLFGRESNGFDAAARNPHHFPGFHFAHVFGVDQIERASFRGSHPRSIQPAETERAEAARVAYSVNFIAGQQEQRICAFHLIESVGDRSGKVSRGTASNQMDDYFRVARGLKNGAAMLESAPHFQSVRQVAIVAERQFSFIAIDHHGLSVHQRRVAGSGITCVADGDFSGKLRNHVGCENLLHVAKALVHVDVRAIGGGDAGGFLSPMLERVEA